MPTKLGQNFLVNKKIVDRIIKEADLKSDDLVLEIGSGKGILTEELAKFAGKVVAVEIDQQLAGLLRSKLRNKKNVKIINEDILKIIITDLISSSPHPASEAESTLSRRERGLEGEGKIFQNTKYQILNTKYKIIANLPYYITSPVIRKFLESDNPPSEMILMVQKEVAERICASPSEIPTISRDAKRISRGRPGKMSILAVSVQYYARPEILFYVEKGNFDPVPEVDSAVIRISRIKKQETRNKDFDKNFFRVVRAGFCAKRKKLANNLANSFHLEKKSVEEKLKTAGVNPAARAQELSVEDWKELSDIFHL